MPVYEFKCMSCNERVEERRSLSERDKKTYHSCGGVLERTLSKPSRVWGPTRNR